MTKGDTHKAEFGDFQTPDGLAAQVVSTLRTRGVAPASVVEPTCGTGSFVVAAIRGFATTRQIVGVEINPEYFAQVDTRAFGEPRRPPLRLDRSDFFSFDWPSLIQDLPEPVLILGNPPWVTSSGLGAMGGKNLPEKSNFQKLKGLDALTGRSNFDIAEWMLIRLLDSAVGRRVTLAMLVKTSTARRVLAHAWQSNVRIERAAMYSINALEHFGVSASACLLVCDLGQACVEAECQVFHLDAPERQVGTVGLRSGALVADAQAYDRTSHLIAQDGPSQTFRWRSGIKHDCSAIMELRRRGPTTFVNGFGEEIHLEPEFVFPMMKGSDVAKGGKDPRTDRWMIVPQRATGDATNRIQHDAPRTWKYLDGYGELLDRRGSSIYRNRPRFAVFGVGPYTFAPWKVAICGLYKKIEFTLVGPQCGKPVVFDDTVNHLSFDSESDARAVTDALNSDLGRQFFDAFVFWDAKRPVTVDLLRRLDISALLRQLGKEVSPRARSSELAVSSRLF